MELLSSTNLRIIFLCWSLGFNATNINLIENYGLSALIPYILVNLFITAPLIFLETSIGQYSNKTIRDVWNLYPIFRGIGFSCIVTLIILNIYANSFCAYFLYYTIISSTDQVFWNKCEWTKTKCFTMGNSTELDCYNCTGIWESTAQQFFKYRVLNLDPKSDKIGSPQLELVCCNLCTILIVTICSFPKTNKILLTLLILPSFQLLAQLFSTLIDPGGLRGFQDIFQFNKEFYEYSILKTIIEESSFNIGLALGAYTTIGSKIKFGYPIKAIVLLNNLANILFKINYEILYLNNFGVLALSTNQRTFKIIETESLLFSKIPQALLFLSKTPQIWTINFYLQQYLIGLRYLLTMALLQKEIWGFRHRWLTFYNIFLVSGGGVIFYTTIGPKLQHFIVEILKQITIPFLITMQLFIVTLYGPKTYSDDMHFMYGAPLKECFFSLFLIPILTGSLFILNLKNFYETCNEFLIFNNFLIWYPLVILILYAIYYGIKKVDFRSNKHWGDIYENRSLFIAENITDEYKYRQAQAARTLDGHLTEYHLENNTYL